MTPSRRQGRGVVGLPDERTGESIALFVVPSDPEPTVEKIRAHCEHHLTGYKQPRRIELRESLPMSPLGKVLRRQLKQEALATPSAAKTPG